MVHWGLLTIALAVASLLTWGLVRFSASREWLDRPVARSAHSQPTPSAGGLGMLVPFLLGVGYYWWADTLADREALVFAACLVLALVGLRDDVRPLSIRWRLPFQVAAALWVIGLAGRLPVLDFGFWQFDSPALINLIAVVSFVWLLNLFNFMDGIDGLAASEAGFVTLLSCLLVINSADRTVASVASLTGAVALGFLLWNRPPATIFMGDTGSNFLGYTIGALAVVSLSNGSMTPWAWLLLLGVFVVDATYTLLYRAISGQRWYEPHNSHAYQHLARRLNSHGRVTLAVCGVNLVWLAPLAWLANRNPAAGFYLAVLGLLPLVLLVWQLEAGSPEKATARATGARLKALATGTDNKE